MTQPQSATQEVIAGHVERVTYYNAENGFCVLRAKARGHRDVVTVAGVRTQIFALNGSGGARGYIRRTDQWRIRFGLLDYKKSGRGQDGPLLALRRASCRH